VKGVLIYNNESIIGLSYDKAIMYLQEFSVVLYRLLMCYGVDSTRSGWAKSELLLCLSRSVLFEELSHCIGNPAVPYSGRMPGCALSVLHVRQLARRLKIRPQQLFTEYSENLRMNEIGVIETHLDFRRMHVHVIVFEGHLNEQKYDREPARLQKPAICLFYCVRDEFVTDESPIQEYVLKPIVCP
jgi:hypothetical protein